MSSSLTVLDRLGLLTAVVSLAMKLPCVALDTLLHAWIRVSAYVVSSGEIPAKFRTRFPSSSLCIILSLGAVWHSLSLFMASPGVICLTDRPQWQ